MVDEGSEEKLVAAAMAGTHDQVVSFITLACKHGKDTHSINISPQATVNDLKEKLQQLTNVLPRGQKLIFKGKVLDINIKLIDAGISNNAKLMMLGSPGIHQGSVAPVKQTANPSSNAASSNASRFKALERTAGTRTFIDNAWAASGIISLRDRRQEVIPKRVWEIGPAARVLDLAGNCLKRFPADVRQLVNLQKLRLSANGLKDEQVDWQGLVTLKHLTTLALDHNLLTRIPSEIGLLSELKVLSVAHNKLVQIAEEIGTFSKLEKLILSHNCLKELPASLGSCYLLAEADFSANFLREIPASLGQITKLKVLNLDHNALKTFPNEVLKGCLELATLSLHGNELTVEYLRQLEGWAEFDIRRRAKHSKQLQFSVLDTSGGFDEGADSQQWHHW
ncbi:hypothetical protein GOP47_0008154 [Adiantum capillus-veneris]|uniref:Ubiquitin-like domain-containing protein n=1 Tax=Adiantum capillus-veneris TaxID=13818 RepID=A0A9D4ZHX2_ADICA|nr:hypothetical protein GOP47_0008154 [Adiantum capillus-veneris]